jgi:hypothetical protein
MVKKKINRRLKWHRAGEITPETDEDVHVWGEKIGQHIGWHDGEIWYAYEHDPYDIEGVSHWTYFPFPPRSNRR